MYNNYFHLKEMHTKKQNKINNYALQFSSFLWTSSNWKWWENKTTKSQSIEEKNLWFFYHKSLLEQEIELKRKKSLFSRIDLKWFVSSKRRIVFENYYLLNGTVKWYTSKNESTVWKLSERNDLKENITTKSSVEDNLFFS